MAGTFKVIIHNPSCSFRVPCAVLKENKFINIDTEFEAGAESCQAAVNCAAQEDDLETAVKAGY